MTCRWHVRAATWLARRRGFPYGSPRSEKPVIIEITGSSFVLNDLTVLPCFNNTDFYNFSSFSFVNPFVNCTLNNVINRQNYDDLIRFLQRKKAKKIINITTKSRNLNDYGIFVIWSRVRESNPPSQLGKLE